MEEQIEVLNSSSVKTMFRKVEPISSADKGSIELWYLVDMFNREFQRILATYPIDASVFFDEELKGLHSHVMK